MADQEDKADDIAPVTSKKEIISSLEDRYIKLLESKIAHLESQLAGKEQEPVPVEEAKPKAPGDALDEEETEPQTNGAPPPPATDGKPPPKPEEPEKESRYAMVISRWDPRKGEFVDSTSDIRDDTKYGPEMKSNRAFTFRKTTQVRRTGDDFASSEFDILFPPLQKLLGRLTSKWGWTEEVTQCRNPFSALIYSWDEALQASSSIVEGEPEEERQARDDLKELLRIISTSSGDVHLDRYFKERKILLSEGTITHDALWTLFPPGTLILGWPCHDEPQVFFVESCDGFVSDDEEFEVVCYSFDWNGSEFGRVPFQMGIEGWGGDRKRITELPFYPLEFYEEAGLDRKQSIEKLKATLEKRGSQYRTFCTAKKGHQMFNYSEGAAYFHRTGVFLERKPSDILDGDLEYRRNDSSSSISDEKRNQKSGSGSSWKSISGAMIVDFSSYMTYQPAKAPILGPLHIFEGHVADLSPERRAKKVFRDMYRVNWDGHPPEKEMTPDQLLCCPPRVLGYALKQKTWVQLLVKNLRKPNDADVSTFKHKLQLDEESKDLISKSVIAHEKGKRKNENGRSTGLEDFAPEKGKGLVIMLYGLPGVGKTLSAESVAQMTGKPLLSVGVSDIGIEGDKVETNLQKVFALAGIWEAVLLFDEADVFLEARGEGDNDLRRNAMVSVLLRVLEYYDGILILTTNRMRSLDIAVQSRIHLAIKFAELNPEQKVSIFRSFLEQLSNKHLVESLSDAMKWVNKEGKRFDFNGRQIRNIISTALGIALAENRQLCRDDLSSVARQTDAFKRDLSTQEAIYRDRQINPRT